jgi:hypothetical protein
MDKNQKLLECINTKPNAQMAALVAKWNKREGIISCLEYDAHSVLREGIYRTPSPNLAVQRYNVSLLYFYYPWSLLPGPDMFGASGLTPSQVKSGKKTWRVYLPNGAWGEVNFARLSEYLAWAKRVLCWDKIGGLWKGLSAFDFASIPMKKTFSVQCANCSTGFNVPVVRHMALVSCPVCKYKFRVA